MIAAGSYDTDQLAVLGLGVEILASCALPLRRSCVLFAGVLLVLAYISRSRACFDSRINCSGTSEQLKSYLFGQNNDILCLSLIHI